MCLLSPVSCRLSSCSSLRLSLPFSKPSVLVFYSFCLQLYRCSVTRPAGILQCESSQVRDKTQMFRLFCHECQRVFHDRLINNQDKMYFNIIVCEMAGENAFPRFITLMLFWLFLFSTTPFCLTLLALILAPNRPVLLHRPGAVVLCDAAHHFRRLHQGQTSLRVVSFVRPLKDTHPDILPRVPEGGSRQGRPPVRGPDGHNQDPDCPPGLPGRLQHDILQGGQAGLLPGRHRARLQVRFKGPGGRCEQVQISPGGDSRDGLSPGLPG